MQFPLTSLSISCFIYSARWNAALSLHLEMRSLFESHVAVVETLPFYERDLCAPRRTAFLIFLDSCSRFGDAEAAAWAVDMMSPLGVQPCPTAYGLAARALVGRMRVEDAAHLGTCRRADLI